MRITKKFLQLRMVTLNTMLRRPKELFQSGSGCKMNVGHLSLDKDATGYMMVEITSEGGGESDKSGRMSAAEMSIFIGGMVKGISAHAELITQLDKAYQVAA